MSLDWVTVAAQVINFLVLIWLLKRFLYRPILDGIDAREAEIAARMAAAAKAKGDAKAAEAAHQAKLAVFEFEKATLLEAAHKEADDEREVLRVETSRMLESEKEDQNRQKAEMLAKYAVSLHAAGAGAILSLTRKALEDLSDGQLEERIVAHLEGQLTELGDDLRVASGTALEAVAVTSFPLSGPAQAHLEKTFQETVGKVPMTFETDSTQSPGLILRLGGARLGWTIDTYMDGLESKLAERLATQSRNTGGVP